MPRIKMNSPADSKETATLLWSSRRATQVAKSLLSLHVASTNSSLMAAGVGDNGAYCRFLTLKAFIDTLDGRMVVINANEKFIIPLFADAVVARIVVHNGLMHLP